MEIGRQRGGPAPRLGISCSRSLPAVQRSALPQVREERFSCRSSSSPQKPSQWHLQNPIDKKAYHHESYRVFKKLPHEKRNLQTETRIKRVQIKIQYQRMRFTRPVQKRDGAGF